MPTRPEVGTPSRPSTGRHQCCGLSITDWNDILFRGVFNQEYNVSLSGGSEKATYYSALGYYVEQGNVESVKNDRFNLTLKTDYRINSKLKVGASVFANRRKQRSYLTYGDGFTNPVYYSRIANPYLRPFDDEGNYIYDVNVQHSKGDIASDFNISRNVPTHPTSTQQHP